MLKTSQFTGSRFAVLAEDMDLAFPDFNAEQQQHVPKQRMSAFFERSSSSSFQKRCKREKKKSKNEHRSLLIATVHEGESDLQFTRSANEIRQECWAEGTNVKADARLEQRHILCHDLFINAMHLNAVICSGLGSS